MAIMTTLSDTCVLSRGGLTALKAMQQGAAEVLHAGGYQHPAGQAALAKLEQRLVASNASPGGAADLLAAALFLDRATAR
jgi:triphosphoribosyl-dephospho-CoA synthase